MIGKTVGKYRIVGQLELRRMVFTPEENLECNQLVLCVLRWSQVQAVQTIENVLAVLLCTLQEWCILRSITGSG